ncbi:hypothetical protein G647_07469 [Cladophialophora carrionii CBS 160.54]|uniref:Uncharacterized protein n=1 Tax=Cladophialophora carrionii CBS 160.54 TaxID=1279043 RepID=V9D2L6_9EURO|nr:uncharacterized protein G647_07469 [Cladophialophora carrionii CBS 160.54]ETI21125.1 hypothetical protein G647_07469 [Cladophialophora carrionii CBS 160.54]
MGALRAGFLANALVPMLILHAAVTMAIPLNTTAVSSTENCVWEFSPTICGEGVSYQELAYPRQQSCIPLPTPMKNVWTNECSSWFGEPDCLPLPNNPHFMLIHTLGMEQLVELALTRMN